MFYSLLKVNHLQPNIPNEITIYIYPFQTIYDSFITWEKVRGNKRCYLHSVVSNKLNLSPQSLNNTEKVHFHLKYIFILNSTSYSNTDVSFSSNEKSIYYPSLHETLLSVYQMYNFFIAMGLEKIEI